MIEAARHPRPKVLLIVVGALMIVGVITLPLSVQNAMAVNRINDDREQDRIESDLASCERGNLFRQQVRDVGAGADGALTGILDLLYIRSAADATAAEIEALNALRAELDAPIADLRAAVAAIEVTDCDSAVPGAREDS